MAFEREEWDDVKETTLQISSSVKKEGEGGARDARAESLPLQLVMKDHGEAGCPPAAHRTPWWSRYPPVAHGRDPTPEQVDAWRKLWPRGEPHAGAGSCQDLRTRGERSPRRSRFAGRACDPMGTHTGAACSWRPAPRGRDPRWGGLWRTAARGKGSGWRSLWRTVSHERKLHAGGEAECEESSPWGTKSSRDNVWWTGHNPRSPSPCAARGEEGEKWEWVEPRKKGGIGGKCFKIWLCFSLSYSDVISDEFNSLSSPSSVCFVRGSNWWVISPCPCLDPRAFHHISSPLSNWGGEVIERFWWAPGICPGQTKTTWHLVYVSLTLIRVSGIYESSSLAFSICVFRKPACENSFWIG